MRDYQVINPSQKIVMGAANRGGKRFFMDLNIHPRRHLVHRALTNFIAPIAALTMIATVVFFPSPGDLKSAWGVATSPFLAETVQSTRGSSDAAFIVEDYAQSVPGLTRQLEANADCFVGLDAATPQRLQECAPAVTAIIAQIVQHQDNPKVTEALETGGNGKLLPQIQMAAAEVCRSLWSTGDRTDAFLDDPACLMAQVTLAPEAQLR